MARWMKVHIYCNTNYCTVQEIFDKMRIFNNLFGIKEKRTQAKGGMLLTAGLEVAEAKEAS